MPSVAVVGSGMAGLTTAYLLTHGTQRQFDVIILESVSGVRTWLAGKVG